MTGIRAQLGQLLGAQDEGPRPSADMIIALNSTTKHVYAGTVDPAEVARRRRRNKAARRSRRINRMRG